MGLFLQEHDIYVGSLLDEFNVRFAPGQRHAKHPKMKETHFGGIEELAVLQKEFKIFKKGTPFVKSARVLNVGAFNNDVKNRWHEYLESLQKHPSNKAGKSGDEAIVDTLIKNFASKNPLPVHFDSHPLDEDKRVLITDKSRPRHFMDTDFITISLPMKPYDSAGAGGKKAAKKKKKG